MRMCWKNALNLTFTWAMLEVELSEMFIKTEDGFFGGKYARYFSQVTYMAEPEDIKRWKICRFVWANKTGDYDPSTGRYDGAIGMLIDGLADSYYRPFDNGVIHPRFADIPNVPNVAEAISPSHLVKQFRQVADQQVIDQNLVESLLSLFHFLIPSASFLTFALVGCLVYWTVSWLFSKIQKSSLPSRRNLQMKIVSFFFMLFIFYIEQFTSNSLSTENLIVRTDSLLYSRQQILETKREFCFWEKGSGEMDLYKKAPANSLLYRIYEKSNKTDPCYFSANGATGNFINRNPEESFTVIPHIQVEFLGRVLQAMIHMDTFVEASFEISQSVRSYLLSKTMPIEKRNFFEACMQAYLEMGFSRKITHGSSPPNHLGIKFEPRGGSEGYLHFNSLQEYIQEHTKVEPLSFDKLNYLFRIYFALMAAIFLVNFAHYFFVRMIDNRRIQLRLLRARMLLVRAKQTLVSFIGKLRTFFNLKRWLASFLSASLYGIKLRN